MSAGCDRAFAALQYLLPKHFLSRVIYAFMRTEQPWLRDRTLKTFLKHYRVNMAEAVVSDPFAYKSFNAFFTRALKSDARPISSDPSAFVSPVDGTVSQCGVIGRDRIVQAKEHSYSLIELLGGDNARSQKYMGGSFATIYLAPYNYHRIHMPFDGTVRETIYVPGDLFSVNAATARTVPRLFARNERVICDFSSTHGTFAMVFVGALFVGSMETIWCGEVNPPPRWRKEPRVITDGIGISLKKGDEAGRFNMGSTVVIVAEPNRVAWTDNLKAGATVRLGERIGIMRS